MIGVVRDAMRQVWCPICVVVMLVMTVRCWMEFVGCVHGFLMMVNVVDLRGFCVIKRVRL